jgi:dipeptidyl aminopeptidase/acylaminoacyl peptidase
MNVLRLVDREAAAEPHTFSPVIVPDTMARPAKRVMMPAIAAAIIIGGVLVSLGAFSLYRRAAESRISAKPELTIQRLTNGVKPVSATISPNGDYFVYDELAEDGQRLWLQQVGQSSRVEIVPPFGKYLGEKTFTPDGSFVYFSASNEIGETSLYRVATFGGPRSVILSDINGAVSFSPDGHELVARYSKQPRPSAKSHERNALLRHSFPQRFGLVSRTLS